MFFFFQLVFLSIISIISMNLNIWINCEAVIFSAYSSCGALPVLLIIAIYTLICRMVFYEIEKPLHVGILSYVL